MIKQALIFGDGTKNNPWHVQGFRNEECETLSEAFRICHREGIEKLKIAYSGRYYILREDGWYHTSDYEECDRIHSLPPEGKKVSNRL